MNEWALLLRGILKDLAGFIQDHILYISVGILGGFVRDINSENFRWRLFLVGFITYGFVSLLIIFALEDFKVGKDKTAFIVGICGYCYRTVLELFDTIVKRRSMKIKKAEGIIDESKKPEVKPEVKEKK